MVFVAVVFYEKTEKRNAADLHALLVQLMWQLLAMSIEPA